MSAASDWPALLNAARMMRANDFVIGRILAAHIDPLPALPPRAPADELHEVAAVFADHGLDDPDTWNAIYRAAGREVLTHEQQAIRLLSKGATIGKVAKQLKLDRMDVLRIKRAHDRKAVPA